MRALVLVLVCAGRDLCWSRLASSSQLSACCCRRAAARSCGPSTVIASLRLGAGARGCSSRWPCSGRARAVARLLRGPFRRRLRCSLTRAWPLPCGAASRIQHTSATGAVDTGARCVLFRAHFLANSTRCICVGPDRAGSAAFAVFLSREARQHAANLQATGRSGVEVECKNSGDCDLHVRERGRLRAHQLADRSAITLTSAHVARIGETPTRAFCHPLFWATPCDGPLASACAATLQVWQHHLGHRALPHLRQAAQLADCASVLFGSTVWRLLTLPLS